MNLFKAKLSIAISIDCEYFFYRNQKKILNEIKL